MQNLIEGIKKAHAEVDQASFRDHPPTRFGEEAKKSINMATFRW
jgi:hypothetical protein